MHEVLPWLGYIALSLRIPGRPHVEFIAAFMLINSILYTAVGVACSVLFAVLAPRIFQRVTEVLNAPSVDSRPMAILRREACRHWNWNTGPAPTATAPQAGASSDGLHASPAVATRAGGPSRATAPRRPRR